MAQVAYSRPAYPVAAPVRPAHPRGADAPNAYDAVTRTRAPYPSAMRRARRRTRLTGLISLTAMALAGWAVLVQPQGPAPTGDPPGRLADAGPAALLRPALATAPAAEPPGLAWMLDRSPALGLGAATAFGDAQPAGDNSAVAGFEPPPSVREIARQVAQAEQARVSRARVAQAVPAPAAPPPARLRVATAEATPAALIPAPAAARPLMAVPLPVARPSELRTPDLRRAVAAPARVAARALPRTRDVFHAAMAEEPSFFETLFGVGAGAPREQPRQALAYASPDTLPRETPRTRIGAAPDSVAGTAVYDITARTVTLPSGEVLEAHSGLGEAMDDPRYVHLRMRGSTPPGTYDLTERERLFHGVRAIRLNPVGGSGAIHGRDGLLAHTYMLRQPGASNGCVSFRDYDRFLQAYLRGEVRRLVVVAGGRGDFFGSRVGMVDRPGRRG